MSENRNQKKAIKFVEKFYYSNCVNSAALRKDKRGKMHDISGCSKDRDPMHT